MGCQGEQKRGPRLEGLALAGRRPIKPAKSRRSRATRGVIYHNNGPDVSDHRPPRARPDSVSRRSQAMNLINMADTYTSPSRRRPTRRPGSPGRRAPRPRGRRAAGRQRGAGRAGSRTGGRRDAGPDGRARAARLLRFGGDRSNPIE